MNNVFPVALIVLFVGAGIVSAMNRAWDNAVYSISAAILNLCVYFRPFSR